MLISDNKQNRYLTYFFICLIILVLTLVACLFFLLHIHQLQIQSADKRYFSFVVASGLKQSSDDLTKMVRLYVVTGKKKYHDYYNEILSIRKGKIPRPLCYDPIYWDLVDDSKRPCPNGQPQSSIDMMIEQNLTLHEYELLGNALALSNQLVGLETRAINAMEGKFEDSSGGYTVQGKPDPELAKNLVFGNEYMMMKARIMEPLKQFFQLVDERTNKTYQRLNNELHAVILAAIVLSMLITSLMIYSIRKALQSISKATEESNMLLLNILPEAIADRLKGGESTIVDEYSQASVLFADIVGFTALTDKIGGSKMVNILNQIFDLFDDLTGQFGIEKVKTIGDCYMAVAGVPIPVSDHAFRMANFALGIKEKINEFNQVNDINLQIRIGMTFGVVIAGVIGHKKFIYDVWGDVVNVASRMESTSLPGEIQITEKMAYLLEEQFEVVAREEMEIKGKNPMKTFFLKGRKK